MARYQEENAQLQQMPDTGAADVATNLANKLSAFSQLAGQERAKVVEKESLAAGMLAGMDKQQPTKTEYSLASQAFNRGLRASYLAEMQTDIRENIGRISSKHPLDPVSFENAALAWENETLNSIDDIELKANIKTAIRQQSYSAYNSIADQARKNALEQMLVTTNRELNALDSEGQAAGYAGDYNASADAVLKAFDVVDEQFNSGLIDADAANTKKIGIQKRAEVERVAGQVYRDFQNLDSFDQALQIMEQKETPVNFNEQEWRDTKQRIYTDLKQKIDRENLDETNNQKFSDEEQKANFETLMGGLIGGTLDGGTITSWLNSGKINGTQAVQLADKMGSRGFGIDKPEVMNQFELAMLDGNYKQARQIVFDNTGSSITTQTAGEYMRRLRERGDTSLLINSQEGKRYLQHLRGFIGYKDSMSSFFDPYQQQRWEMAILEYEDKVNAGADPRATMFEVVNNYTTPEQRFEGMRNPISADSKDDLPGAMVKLKQMRESNTITEKQYLEEIKYIKDQLIPAKQSNDAWNRMLTENNKVQSVK